jgi:Caspase domain
MDGNRSALIVASDNYTDPGLQRLRAPASDAQALAGVLRDPDIGGFEVRTLLNEPAHEVALAVEEFFADRRPDDLLLLHFSCHGVKDEGGELYFAAANTRMRRLAATAVSAEFVNRRMGRSRSRRVVLLLDCCYAGAFERGMTARAGAGMDIEEQFGGRGRAVITASSAMEYAFEGDELADAREQAPSVFTSALVEGLETGEADRDQDGLVALDELYDYVYDRVRAVTPNQTPGKWTFGVQGELVIARRSRPVTTPAPLPPELQEAADSPFAGVRAGVVPELARLLRSRHAGLALAARLTLERLADDDSRATSAGAAAALAGSAAADPAEAEPAQPESAVEPRPEPSVATTTTRAATTPARTGLAAAPPGAAPASAAPAGTGAASQPPTPAARGESRSAGMTAEPSTAARAAAEERAVQVAGWLAVAGAVLMGFGLLLAFQWDSNLIKDQDTFALGIALTAVFGLGAGIGTLREATPRLAGPGMLLGVAAASTRGLVQLLTEPLRDGGGYGAGLVVEVGAHVVLLAAGCVAAVALARSGDVQLHPQALRTWSSRLITLLGVAGTVALLVVDRRILNLGIEWYWSFVPIWLTVLALLVPAAAAVALPRRFGTWLLAGWIAGSSAVVTDYLIWNASQVSQGKYDIGRTALLFFAVTLLGLLVAAVLHLRDV